MKDPSEEIYSNSTICNLPFLPTDLWPTIELTVTLAVLLTVQKLRLRDIIANIH